MDLGLKDRTAIVTGGAAGIGKAASKALAEEGVDVAIFDIDSKQIEVTAAEIHDATGRKIKPFIVDMTVREKIEAAVNQVVDEFGRLDILVNNAGASKFGDPLTIEAEAFAETMDLKYLGYVNCARSAANHMVKHRWGRIINVIGSGGKQTLPVHIPGGASNAALWLFTKGFGLHLAPHGVLVNGISPGLVATERMVRLVQSSAETQGITYAEAEREYYKDIPLGRAAQPEEVTNVILFLASERASYFVGSNLFMDGGLITAI
jgi:NAD(P)-dependent dehydrogenase (short-subunit alcohol dehydrogenase family)